MKRPVKPPDGMSKAVWSDSCAHLGADDSWPAHAVPLWVFAPKDLPRPGYREEVTFRLREEKYANFAVRLRCGDGDRHGGGTVGIAASLDRREVCPQTQGQLIQVLDVVVQPDNSVLVSAIGDADFLVLKTWMPRGMLGLLMAYVDVQRVKQPLAPIIETCATESSFTIFARMLMAVPRLVECFVGPDLFTTFVPTNDAFATLGMTEDELLARPDLETLVSCHIVKGKVTSEAMYSGRTLQAIDGSIMQMTFARWPKGNPAINGVLVEHFDVFCSNGVIHSIVGVLMPSPAPARRRR